MTSPLLQEPPKKNTINREKRIEILKAKIRFSKSMLEFYIGMAMDHNEKIKALSKELKELEL